MRDLKSMHSAPKQKKISWNWFTYSYISQTFRQIQHTVIKIKSISTRQELHFLGFLITLWYVKVIFQMYTTHQAPPYRLFGNRRRRYCVTEFDIFGFHAVLTLWSEIKSHLSTPLHHGQSMAFFTISLRVLNQGAKRPI